MVVRINFASEPGALCVCREECNDGHGIGLRPASRQLSAHAVGDEAGHCSFVKSFLFGSLGVRFTAPAEEAGRIRPVVTVAAGRG